MEDDLRAAHGVVNALVAPQLAFDDAHVEAGEVLAPAGREVVEHAHLVAPLDEGAHEVRADEPAAARDEDAAAHRSATTWKFGISEPGTGSRSRRERASIASATR